MVASRASDPTRFAVNPRFVCHQNRVSSAEGVQEGTNVARKAKTQTDGAASQSTQRSGAAGAGLQRD